MTDVLSALTALREGALLALQFNPLVAAVTAAIAGALLGWPKRRRQERWWAVPVLAAGWLIGDGLRVLGSTRDFADGLGMLHTQGAPAWSGWTTLGVWALGTLALGYVIPALVGGAVGRRVTHGTGWLAAAAIASTLSLVIAGAVGALG